MDDLTRLPEQITPGTTVAYRRTYSDFPASAGWTLVLKLVGASVASINATPDGDSFLFELDNAATTALAAGNYRWEERATLSGRTYIADEDVVVVRDNLAAATAGSLQSFHEKLLAQVEAVLNARFGVGGTAIDPAEKYMIDGRQIERIPTRELLDIRARERRAVRAEATPGQLGPQIRVTFSGVESENTTPWLGQRL